MAQPLKATASKAAENRTFLKAVGRAAHAPHAPIAALTLINSVGAGGFALCLTLSLSGRASSLVLGGLASALMLRAGAAWSLSRLCVRHARQVKATVRRDALRAVLGRTRGGETSLGEAVAAVVDEIEALDGYFSRYRPAEIAARIEPILIAILIALASPVAASLLLLTLVPFVAIMALAGSAAAAQADRQFEALARLSDLFVDRVRALPIVLAFQAEAEETARVAAAAQAVGERTLSVLRIAFISSAALEFFAALSVAMIAVYAGFGLLGLLPFKLPEKLDFAHAFFALALAPEFYAPLRRLAGAYHDKQLGEAAVTRLRPLLNSPIIAPKPLARFEIPPRVVLQDLVLGFDELTIGPINADCPAGGLTAILGPTGSGKSSLLTAILGMTPLRAGSIDAGGTGSETAGGFAESAAWAGQAPVFIPGTLIENLMAAAPGVSREAARAMADRVGLGPALKTRAEGAETDLDERGSGLSGGERRRLALARALLKPSALLLLDEPTADLDAEAETKIIRMLRDAAGERTVIVATHSERVAEAADYVVRLT